MCDKGIVAARCVNAIAGFQPSTPFAALRRDLRVLGQLVSDSLQLGDELVQTGKVQQALLHHLIVPLPLALTSRLLQLECRLTGVEYGSFDDDFVVDSGSGPQAVPGHMPQWVRLSERLGCTSCAGI
jgi:hypothetical protein